MSEKNLPLKEVSIEDLFNGSESCVYEIPIYQRNYAWEDDEISALVQDVYDAYKKHRPVYYIGTLVTFYRGDGRFEIIDGQQRLTTIRLILASLDIPVKNLLTYSARKRSDDTIKSIPDFNVDETDDGIVKGFQCAKNAIHETIQNNEELKNYKKYFRNNVHLIRYKVPKDIDLNQYFEVMNSRGEQLEMHEIVKANLMQRLPGDEERRLFNIIWEACSEMSSYVQQNLERIKTEKIFGQTFHEFLPENFDDLMNIYANSAESVGKEPVSILSIINHEATDNINTVLPYAEEIRDRFLPIIDFPNFLLIVLKITRMSDSNFSPADFNLDDKELLNEFDKYNIDVRKFAFNLLKVRFFLDNYIVHHSKEEDTLESNPWRLQVWNRDPQTKRSRPKNLSDDSDVQKELVHLLSMFEVSFTARQRKNYLFYCLMYLMNNDKPDILRYKYFVNRLADTYFQNVYLDQTKLNIRNTPLPGSFDAVMLDGRKLSKVLLDEQIVVKKKDPSVFNQIYGDGTKASRGIPLFIFNYLDMKIWQYYSKTLRGEQADKGRNVRTVFFSKLGCSDFELRIFELFYFSRTRRSLEHFYPQANATGWGNTPDENQINCFGNYAMIGSEVNSSGSNWSPRTKLDHYLDPSGKISRISVASLKFMIMMQMCRDKVKTSQDDVGWDFEQIKEHQQKMVLLMME